MMFSLELASLSLAIPLVGEHRNSEYRHSLFFCTEKLLVNTLPCPQGKQDILKKIIPIIAVMTMYQSLLMALVSLPFCVLESWGLKK